MQDAHGEDSALQDRSHVLSERARQLFEQIEKSPKGQFSHLKDLFTVTDSEVSDEEVDDEEPLIVQLMESMFNRKKTVFES